MKGKCAICGDIRELTKEHLPQKAFYPKAIRSQIQLFNVVNACGPCNNQSNVSDELAKVVFGMVAKTPWNEHLQASIDATLSNNIRLRRLIDENTREEEIALADGGVRDARIFKLPYQLNDQLLGTVERMIKAFYFMHTGKVLVEHYEISFFNPNGVHPDLLEEIVSGVHSTKVHSVNEGTVRYSFFKVQKSDIVFVVNLFASIQLYFVMKELGWRDKIV